MNSQIVQTILSLFNADATHAMAAKVGEEPSKVKSALESIIPLLMKGFASKSAEGTSAVSNIMDMASAATSSSWFTTASDWFSGHDTMLSKGKEILHTLFGGHNVERIADSVAAHNGIKSSSAATLMQMAAPLALGTLGKYVGENNLNAGSLATWFSKEKVHLESAIPATIGSTLGAGKAAASAVGNAASSAAQFSEQKAKGNKWLLPLLLLLLAAGLIWWFAKGCNPEKTDVVAADTTTKNTNITAPSMSLPTFKWNADSSISYTYGDTMLLELPGGASMRVPNNGAEVLLVDKIKAALANGLDTTAEGKKSGWLNLYDVQFSKMLNYRDGASNQINNIATILKAYPGVHLKIGGYTDNTGNADVNTKLSQERAELVAQDLGKAGVATQLDKAEGYGDQFPIADNATSEGRAQNRRVSARITSVSK